MKAKTPEQIEAHRQELFDRAFESGVSAGLSGVSVLANPYPFCSIGRNAWAQGYSEGCQQESWRFQREYGLGSAAAI